MKPPHQRFRGQRGLSLLELMVGLAIGMLVVLAALVSTSQSRQSGTTLHNAIALDRDAASVWRVLSSDLRHAGAHSLQPAGGTNQVEFRPWQAAPVVNGTATSILGANGAAGAPDSLTLTVDLPHKLPGGNCLGRQASGHVAISTYSLKNEELDCSVTAVTFDIDGTRKEKTEAAALVAGVRDFQVRYAEWTGASLQYVDSPAQWAQVTAVEVCLHLAGPVNGEVAADITDCSGAPRAVADGRLHRVYRQVFQLRNLDRR